MELRFWAATDTGRVRDHNEDNFLVDQNLQLFVVCDGMGGHAAGEVASAVCVRTVRDVIAAHSDLLGHIRENPGDEVANEKLKQLLRTAIQSGNTRIFEMAKQDPSRRGMGTTCVALVMAGTRGFVGYVGDSRMYRIRDEQVEQVTDDHSLLNEMIRQGKVAPGTSESEFPHKNAVTRAVGVRESVDVDAFTLDVRPGDRLLMCSDGLNEYFDESIDLLEMMGAGEPEETTNQCINFANQAGGKDNITVIIVDCEPEVAVVDDAPERAEVIEILRKTAYFHYLMPPELEQIRKMATRIEREADELVVGEGENRDKLFLILKGSVSLQLDGEQVSVLTTGEHFGEMALIDAQDEQDSSMVVQSLEPSIFLAIERDQFVGLLRTAPGLAIKLLWNFVQVFADRLQSVPPEYRFTPDEWRGDPDAIADVTPPAGTLVFEEDLERAQEKSEPKIGQDIDPDVPPVPTPESSVGVEVSAGVTTSRAEFEDTPWSENEPTDNIEPPELPEDLRKTMGLEEVDLDRMEEERNSRSSIPAVPAVSSEPESQGQSSQGQSSQGQSSQAQSSQAQSSQAQSSQAQSSQAQSSQAPSVSINHPSSTGVPRVSESPGDPSGADADDGSTQDPELRATVQLDWEADTEQGRNMPVDQLDESGLDTVSSTAGEHGDDGDETEEWSADPEALSALKEKESTSTSGSDGSSVQPSGVLKKATHRDGGAGASDPSKSAAGNRKNAGDNGSDDDGNKEQVQSRVMVSPDLISDHDEDD